MAGHALVGCASAVAQGGRCGPGALSAAAGSFAGPLLRGLDFTQNLVAHAVVGGVASVAGGGNFANGAVTAAFGYLFNQNAGRTPIRPDPSVLVEGPYEVFPGPIGNGPVDPSLDPAGLNAANPITPVQEVQIASTVQTILNAPLNATTVAMYLGLFPHPYNNFPDPTTGAVLPGVPGTGGYTAYDVGGPSMTTTGMRIVVNDAAGIAYFTNTHYRSFRPFGVGLPIK